MRKWARAAAVAGMMELVFHSRAHAEETWAEKHRIAVGGLSGEIPIYNTETAERVATCKADQDGVFVLRFRPDGKQLAAGGFDGHVRLYDPASGKPVKEFQAVPLQVSKASE